MYFPLLCLSILLASVASESLVKVGNFKNYAQPKDHGISGEVFVKDEKTLVIKGFSYDGTGPDPFFWAGKSGKPDTVDTADTVIITYPSDGKSYSYEDENVPILKRAFTNEEIELTLPGGLKPKEIKWLSVWCRKFKVNFGDIFFPDNMESELEDIYDDIFDNEISPQIDWQDPDSESENSSTTLNLSFVAGLLTPIFAYFF